MTSIEEIISQIYRIFTKLFFVLDTFCFCLILYLITAKSKLLSHYKYYLLLNFIASYILSLICFLFEPIPLMENALGLYFDGLLGSFGLYGIMIAIVVFIFLTGVLSVVILYRFSQVKED